MLITLWNVSVVIQKPTAGDDADKPSNKQGAARNRIQEMRMAMKAKMAVDKEKLRAEKRHQEVRACVYARATACACVCGVGVRESARFY